MNRQSLKWRLVDKQANMCAYCGCFFSKDINSKKFPTIDHVTPLSKGGADSIENMLAACKTCNSTKGRHSLDNFRRVEYYKRKKIPYLSKEQRDWICSKNEDMRNFMMGYKKTLFFFETEGFNNE